MASPEAFRRQDVGSDRPSDAEVQGQRAVLYRRRHDLRRGRSADQFVGRLAAAGGQRLRSRLFQANSSPIRKRLLSSTEPVLSVFTGGWTTVIAHRLSGPDGVFLGVMARRIDPANYEKFFASVVLGPGAAISMFHGDGTMLARYPHVEELIGRNFKSAPLIQRVLAQGGLQTHAREQPGRSHGPARRGRHARPFPDRGRRHQHGRSRARRLARANPLPDRRGRRCLPR